jgi:histidyl-tRNA synthetase
LAHDDEAPEALPGVFVAAADGQSEPALALVPELRRAGLRAELDLGGRAMKGQMKQADRAGAAVTVILEEDGGAQVRDMQTGEQRELDLSNAVEELSR